MCDRYHRKKMEITNSMMPVRSPEVIRLYQSTTKLDDEVSESLDHLLQASMEFIGADKCSLELYDQNQRSFEMIAQAGFDQELQGPSQTVLAGNSVWASAAEAPEADGVQGDYTGSTSSDFEPTQQTSRR
jgi:hypothetical protein